MDICELSATQLGAALRRGDLSAVDALDAVLRRADEIAGSVNPFSVRLDDRARLAALAADEALARDAGGPLCGVPVTTKDSHWMTGVESTSGSRARASNTGSPTAIPTKSATGLRKTASTGTTSTPRCFACWESITNASPITTTASAAD